MRSDIFVVAPPDSWLLVIPSASLFSSVIVAAVTAYLVEEEEEYESRPNWRPEDNKSCVLNFFIGCCIVRSSQTKTRQSEKKRRFIKITMFVLKGSLFHCDRMELIIFSSTSPSLSLSICQVWSLNEGRRRRRYNNNFAKGLSESPMFIIYLRLGGKRVYTIKVNCIY